MTLKEAMEIVTDRYRGNYTKTDPDFGVAISLLIEAGKRVIGLRTYPDCAFDVYLPGETKE